MSFSWIELEECESTNDEAWRHAPGPTIVSALTQTKGRGRQGRRWENDDRTNVIASLILPAPVQGITWMPLAAGVAAAEALKEVAQDIGELRLKWPNDLYWGATYKLGGILCETKMQGDTALGFVVGIGINLFSAPDLKDMETAAFFEALDKPTGSKEQRDKIRRHVIGAWAQNMARWYNEISDGRYDELRAKWLEYARLSDFNQLSVHDKDGKTVKIEPIGLDEQGRLQAKLNDTKIILDQADSL
jgi:biotin-[acetyl-CoA-carboxylase] ligase BirA-like protein